MTLITPAVTDPTATAAPPPQLPHYGIGFRPAISRGFTKFVTFDGRAGLSEFWWWSTFRTSVVAALGTGTILISDTGDDAAATVSVTLGMVCCGFLVATFLPSLAIAVRRLHDTGRSGAWYLISWVPVIGPLVLICLLAERTSPAAYRFGPPFIMVDPSRRAWAPQYDPPAR